MSLVIDANMLLFADKMNITSSRMIREYGLSSIDEMIEKEAEKGNYQAIEAAREYYQSPAKLVKIFRLTSAENKYAIIKNLSIDSRNKLLPYLEKEDMVIGLNFFTQEKLLKLLEKVDIKELVNVVMDAFSLEDVVLMYKDEDLAELFMNKDLKKELVIEQLKAMPPEAMQKFVEGVTGMPYEKTDPMELISNIENMPQDQYRKFMASIDPDIQRQLVYQMAKVEPETLTLFKNEAYTGMLEKLQKPDMVKSMAMLEKDTLVEILMNLNQDYLSIVESQVDEFKLAAFLQNGRMDVLQSAMIM